jgi:hypothetical protein
VARVDGAPSLMSAGSRSVGSGWVVVASKWVLWRRCISQMCDEQTEARDPSIFIVLDIVVQSRAPVERIVMPFAEGLVACGLLSHSALINDPRM